MTRSLPDFDLDQYLPYQLTTAADQVSTALSRRYKAQFDISVAEWRVLLNLGYSDSKSIRDIERRVRLEKSKVSRAVSRLEAKGYLTKRVDKKDRRLLFLSLSATGIDLLGQLVPIALDYQTQLEKSLGKDTAHLRSALNRMLDAPD